MISEGRTLVPLRVIFEALGAEVLWDDSTKTVTASKDGTEISLTIGSPEMKVNGASVSLDVPGRISDGRTMVPLRAVSESLGCNVAWSNMGKIVSVYERE